MHQGAFCDKTVRLRQTLKRCQSLHSIVQGDSIVESASSLLDTDNKYEYLQKKS